MNSVYRAVELGSHTLDFIVHSDQFGWDDYDGGVVTADTTHIAYVPQLAYDAKTGTVTFANWDLEIGARNAKQASITMAGLLSYVQKIKRFMPWVKIVISLPGKTAEEISLADIASDPLRLAEFVRSVGQIVADHAFDGVQVDVSTSIGLDGLRIFLSELKKDPVLSKTELSLVLPPPGAAAAECSLHAAHLITSPVETSVELKRMCEDYRACGVLADKIRPFICTYKLGSLGTMASACEVYQKSMKQGHGQVLYSHRGAQAVVTERETGFRYPLTTPTVVKHIGATMRNESIRGFYYGPAGGDLHSRHQASIVGNANRFLPLA